ncbi:MAG: glycosyltransferase family 1 protein, partial [Pseudomonadota bacterium]
MQILIITDAWRPQVNGVVRTYERLREELATFGVTATFITPEGRR